MCGFEWGVGSRWNGNCRPGLGRQSFSCRCTKRPVGPESGVHQEAGGVGSRVPPKGRWTPESHVTGGRGWERTLVLHLLHGGADLRFELVAEFGVVCK